MALTIPAPSGRLLHRSYTPDGECRNVSGLVNCNEGLFDGHFKAHFKEFHLAPSLPQEERSEEMKTCCPPKVT